MPPRTFQRRPQPLGPRSPSSQDGRRLQEFSVTAVYGPHGDLHQHSMQLHWAETPSTRDLQLTTRSPSQRPNKSLSSWSSSGAASFSNVFSSSSSPSGCRSCCSSTSPIRMSQIVRLVSVDLRVAFFERPGFIVRKQVVKEVRNDMTVLEVLRSLLKRGFIRIDLGANSPTARLFWKRSEGKHGHEEVDYLQWRNALLAEMTSADSVQLLLDLTDIEEPDSLSTSTKCDVDFDFYES